MAVLINLDKPRELRLSLRSLKFLEISMGLDSINEVVAKIEKGSAFAIMEFLKACLTYQKGEVLDSDFLEEHIDNYVSENGMDDLTNKIGAVIEESFLKKNQIAETEQARVTAQG